VDEVLLSDLALPGDTWGEAVARLDRPAVIVLDVVLPPASAPIQLNENVRGLRTPTAEPFRLKVAR
jgi:hypothetical protein